MQGGDPPYPPGSLVERALAWDVAGTRHALQTTDFTDDELNEVICGCILKATGCPQWQGTDWQPYKLLVQQLTWSYAHLPGPSQQQLQVLQELMQYVPFTYHQELGASAHDLAAASGCVQLLRVLLQQPPSITTARIGIQQDWEGSLPLELPQMALVRSLTDNSRTVMVPRAVRWPGQTWVKEEASHLQWPGSVVLAAASGSAEAVYAYLNAGWTADGGYRGYYAGTYAGLVPIHWAAACLAPEVVEVLLHYGADPCEVFPPSGQTPLHLAAAPTDWKGTGQAWRALTQVGELESRQLERQRRTLKVLLDAGAQLEVVDFWEQTPLMSALATGNRHAAAYLLNAGAVLPPNNSDLGDPMTTGLLEGQFRRADPQTVVRLIAAGASWLPETPWQSLGLVHTMSGFKWLNDDMDHLLRNWVSISAFLLFVKKAGLQQQEAALKWLLRQLQLTYPAFCMWQRWPPAQLMAGSDKAAATQAGDTAAAASYTTYCTINKFLQHPDSMQRLLELAGQEDVLSLIQSCAKLPASCCDTGGAGSSSRCERGPEAAPRGGQGMESSSSSSSIHAPAVAAPVQSLYAHMADTMFRSVLAAWDRLRLLLLDPQQWVVDAVERPTEQLTDSCGVHSSSSSSSSRCTGSRADEARTAALGDGSGADESRLCDSSSSSAPKSGLTALVPVWGYGTQPLTADGKPYVVNAAAVRACVAASLQLPTYTADGVSPWQAAVQLGDPRLLEALLSCPSNLIAELRQQWQQALEHAADQFQIAALRLLLQTGAAVMSKEVHAVWSGAIQKGEEQVALALMEAGIDVNGPCGEEGDTALLALARARSTWGLDPDQSDLPGKYTSIFRGLVHCGAQLEVRDAQGLTPLLSALNKGANVYAGLLIDHGADLNARFGHLNIWDLACHQLGIWATFEALEVLLARGLTPPQGLLSLPDMITKWRDCLWQVPLMSECLRHVVLRSWLREVPMADADRQRKQQAEAAKLRRFGQGYNLGAADLREAAAVLRTLAQRRQQEAEAMGRSNAAKDVMTFATVDLEAIITATDMEAAAAQAVGEEVHGPQQAAAVAEDAAKADAAAAALLAEVEAEAAAAAEKAAKKRAKRQRQAAARRAAAGGTEGNAAEEGSTGAADAEAGAPADHEAPSEQQQMAAPQPQAALPNGSGSISGGSINNRPHTGSSGIGSKITASTTDSQQECSSNSNGDHDGGGSGDHKRRDVVSSSSSSTLGIHRSSKTNPSSSSSSSSSSSHGGGAASAASPDATLSSQRDQGTGGATHNSAKAGKPGKEGQHRTQKEVAITTSAGSEHSTSTSGNRSRGSIGAAASSQQQQQQQQARQHQHNEKRRQEQHQQQQQQQQQQRDLRPQQDQQQRQRGTQQQVLQRQQQQHQKQERFQQQQEQPLQQQEQQRRQQQQQEQEQQQRGQQQQHRQQLQQRPYSQQPRTKTSQQQQQQQQRNGRQGGLQAPQQPQWQQQQPRRQHPQGWQQQQQQQQAAAGHSRTLTPQVPGQMATSEPAVAAEAATVSMPAHCQPVVQQPAAQAPPVAPLLPVGAPGVQRVSLPTAGGTAAPPALQLPGVMGLLLCRAAAVAQGPGQPGSATGGSGPSQAGAVLGVPTGGGESTAPTASTSAVAAAGGGVDRASSSQPAQVGSSGNSSSTRRPQGARECVVCWEDEPRVLLLPCRHMCCCERCSQALQQRGAECPMCRAAVEQHIPVFL